MCSTHAAHREAQGGDAGELEAGEDVIIVPAVSDEEAEGEVPRRVEGAQAVSASRSAAGVAQSIAWNTVGAAPRGPPRRPAAPTDTTRASGIR